MCFWDCRPDQFPVPPNISSLSPSNRDLVQLYTTYIYDPISAYKYLTDLQPVELSKSKTLLILNQSVQHPRVLDFAYIQISRYTSFKSLKLLSYLTIVPRYLSKILPTLPTCCLFYLFGYLKSRINKFTGSCRVKDRASYQFDVKRICIIYNNYHKLESYL